MDHVETTRATTAIQVRGLRVSFQGREVLHGLDLDVAPGGPTVVVGRSGSGKTTFLRALNRLNECLPGCRTSGSVTLRLDGEEVDAYDRKLPVEELRRRVGMVFQAPNVLPMSVARNITLPLSLTRRLDPATLRARAEQALRETGLWDEVKDRLDDPATSLSGGQQQRLCLARALAFKPDVLLLDEPTASLDFKAARGVEEHIARLAEHYTVIVVSHGLEQARRLGGTMLALCEGRHFEPIPPTALTDAAALQSLLERVL